MQQRSNCAKEKDRYTGIDSGNTSMMARLRRFGHGHGTRHSAHLEKQKRAVTKKHGQAT